MSRRLRDTSACVHCGAPATTVDDVPPRAVFPGRPRTLRVPACLPCNNGASKDDEYFALIVSRRHRDRPQPVGAVEVAIRMERAYRRSSGLRATVDPHTVLIAPRTPAGIYLPVQSWTMLSMERVERVFGRIVRGIHWHRTGERLPRDLHLVAASKDGLGPEHVKWLASLEPAKWDGGYVRRRDVFCYLATRYAPFGEHGTLWLLGFYNEWDFVVQTGGPVQESASSSADP